MLTALSCKSSFVKCILHKNRYLVPGFMTNTITLSFKSNQMLISRQENKQWSLSVRQCLIPQQIRHARTHARTHAHTDIHT